MPFETLQFRYPWRAYQKRVLDTVQAHLKDRRLHIVAAPGAGKTTLGLEIFRLLQQPTFVLSPTRVIRDQWIGRLSDFCTVDNPAELDWVSNSIHEPKILTSVTYQALHMQFTDRGKKGKAADNEFDELKELKKSDVDSFIHTLEEHQVKVLILDEAHHLKAEWWKSLEKIASHFSDLTLVSLTATPPYDVTGREWLRYKQLCGPIDEEISVPELVKAGILCPHQDYVWASNATTGEIQKILDYDETVSTLLESLKENKQFIEIVSAHPWQNSKGFEQELIRNPEIAVAILLFNKVVGIPNTPHLLTLLDLREDELPEMERRWWQVLIDAVIFSKTFEHSAEHQQFVDQLKKQLRASKLLYRTTLSIERSSSLSRTLSLSASKIASCGQIHRLEHEKRGGELRQVILTDYIRDESLASGVDAGELDLGAWPIFKHLIETSPIAGEMGLLTGRLCIIPKAQSEQLVKRLGEDQVSLEKIPSQPEFLNLSAQVGPLIRAFTDLLEAGHLKTIISTRSLLGEGWDAPSVNSLILASSVGSFVLTNQMRGRAIRIDRKDPDKISSIWHLIAINTRSVSGWSDYQNLQRRFDTFVGLSENGDFIQSGFERIGIEFDQSTRLGLGNAQIGQTNDEMWQRHRNLGDVAQRWEQALVTNESAQITPSVQLRESPNIRQILIAESRNYLMQQAGFASGSLLFGASWLADLGALGGPLGLLPAVGLALPVLVRLPRTIPTLRRITSHLPVTGSLTQIGNALLDALITEGHIQTPAVKLKLNATQLPDSSFSVSLAGGTYYESSLFADCISEILGPIDNPRYLVVRQGAKLGIERKAYHAVPSILGSNKGAATTFHHAWQKYVCRSELIYTRFAEGRAELIKARTRSLSVDFQNGIKRQERWW